MEIEMEIASKSERETENEKEKEKKEKEKERLERMESIDPTPDTSILAPPVGKLEEMKKFKSFISLAVAILFGATCLARILILTISCAMHNYHLEGYNYVTTAFMLVFLFYAACCAGLRLLYLRHLRIMLIIYFVIYGLYQFLFLLLEVFFFGVSPTYLSLVFLLLHGFLALSLYFLGKNMKKSYARKSILSLFSDLNKVLIVMVPVLSNDVFVHKGFVGTKPDDAVYSSWRQFGPSLGLLVFLLDVVSMKSLFFNLYRDDFRMMLRVLTTKEFFPLYLSRAPEMLLVIFTYISKLSGGQGAPGLKNLLTASWITFFPAAVSTFYASFFLLRVLDRHKDLGDSKFYTSSTNLDAYGRRRSEREANPGGLGRKESAN